MNFKFYSLNELVNIKYGKNQKKVENPKGKYPIYGTGGLMGYADDFLYNKPSVLIGRKGSIEKVKYVEQPFWTVDTLFYTEVNENKVIAKYLYYLMSLINLSSYNEGTSIPSLRTETLYKIDFNIPPLKYQKEVLQILNSIDDKIKLNRMINNNLLEQIKATYHHICYEYDDKIDKKDSSFGLIPYDYQITTLDNLIEKNTEKVNDRKLYVLSAVNSGNLVLSEEYFSKQVFSKDISKYIIVKHEEFAYNPARVNIGSIGMNEFDFDGCVSPVYVAFKVKYEFKNFLKIFFETKTFNIQVISRSNGSVRQTLNYKDFSKIELILPPKNQIDFFNKIYEINYKIIQQNKREIENLNRLRDTLLPKLMSGEIDVSEINFDLD